MIVYDYYILVTKDGDSQQIDQTTAEQIAAAIEDRVLVTLWFDDLSGSRTFLRLEDVASIYHTNPEIRRAVREHNKAMRAEDPAWEG